jgi:probable F420-dependent oxidoreductase
MRHPAGDEYQVKWGLGADNLIGDVDLAGFREPGLWRLRHREAPRLRGSVSRDAQQRGTRGQESRRRGIPLDVYLLPVISLLTSRKPGGRAATRSLAPRAGGNLPRGDVEPRSQSQEDGVISQIRFGVVSESVLAGPEWADHARRVEDAGVGSLLIRDHFSAGAFGQQLAPFSALAAAAAVTSRLHVGTMVLSNDFRHPAIVAHEAASLHHLSGGRFELGIGAGWYQPEYSAAGIPFDGPRQRIDRLEESLAIIRGLLAGGPVHHSGAWYQIDGLDLDVMPARQGYPRLLIGAGGPRMLRIAARQADIVGLLPAPIKDSDDREDPHDRLPPALDERLALLRSAAGDRFGQLELSALATFSITGRRRASTEELIARRGWDGIDAETVWQMPTVYIGSVSQIREDLQARQERFGLSYLVTADHDLPTLTRIIAGP